MLLRDHDHCCGTAVEVAESGPASKVLLRMRCQECGSGGRFPLASVLVSSRAGSRSQVSIYHCGPATPSQLQKSNLLEGERARENV